MENLNTEIENEVKRRILKSLAEMDLNLEDVAKSRISLFAARLFEILTKRNERFDLIISGGNSGITSLHLAQEVFKVSNIDYPPEVLLPIYRYAKNGEKDNIRFDNNHLLPKVEKELKDKGRIENVLFVDDEIRIGYTAKTCFELVQKSLEKQNKNTGIQGVILAENHFFEWHHNKPSIPIKYFSHAKFLYGKNHLFTYLISDELQDKVNKALDMKLNKHKVMTLLTGHKLKKRTNKEAYFDTTPHKKLKKNIPNLQEIEDNLREQISVLVKGGINQYKNGEVNFKF